MYHLLYKMTVSKKVIWQVRGADYRAGIYFGK